MFNLLTVLKPQNILVINIPRNVKLIVFFDNILDTLLSSHYRQASVDRKPLFLQKAVNSDKS